jgi:hypothetical protein
MFREQLSRVFGPHVWAIRLPALLAAGIVASSSIRVEYSVDARGYTLLGCRFAPPGRTWLQYNPLYSIAIAAGAKGWMKSPAHAACKQQNPSKSRRGRQTFADE